MDKQKLKKYIKPVIICKNKITSANTCINLLRNETKSIGLGGRTELEKDMLLLVHSLEKGMVYQNIKREYGKNKAIDLINHMHEYLKNGYSKDTYVWRESIDMLNTYITYQKESGKTLEILRAEMDIDFIELESRLKSSFDGGSDNIEIENIKTGICSISRETMLEAATMEFNMFISSRHSVRSFQNNPVEEHLILQAVTMAGKYPSACNRQPVKVYYSLNKDILGRIDEMVPGNHGFKGKIPNYMIITCDRAYFGKNEHFQWYINGGIFVSYMILSLHSLGVGGCIFQWPVFHKDEKTLKKLAGISSTEAVVAIIGFGNYTEKSKCIYASRRPLSEILVKF